MVHPAGRTLTTFSTPGGSAEHSMAPTLGDLGARRENLVGRGNRWALLSAGSSQGAALKCQSLVLLGDVPAASLGDILQQNCVPSSRSWSPCHPLPHTPQAGGDHPPRVGVLLCLALLGAPLLCLCSQCPSLVSPCRCSIPKATSGGSFHCGGCSPKRFSRGEHNGIPADTEPQGCVCPCSGGTRVCPQVHGVGSWGGGAQFWAPSGVGGAGVLGRVGECR